MSKRAQSPCTTFFGVVVDIVLVLVALADQATDVYIIYQLYTDKTSTRGAEAIRALMITFAVLASVLSAVGFMFRIPSRTYNGTLGQIVCFSLFFLLVSPLLPLANFILSVCYPDSFDSVNEVNWWHAQPNDDYHRRDDDDEDNDKNTEMQEQQQQNEEKKKKKATASRDMFSSLVAPQHEQLAALDGAIARRAGSYAIFGITTAAESIPNAILILIYLSINQDSVDWAVILSLILSLASIATKAFVIARSATIPAVVFKSLIVIFDTFMVAFLAATLFSESAPKEVSLFGATGVNGTAAFEVSRMTAAFVYIKVAVWTVCVCAVMVYGMWLMRKEADCNSAKQICGTIFIVVVRILGFFLCVLPIAIAQQAICLSWIVIAQTLRSPGPRELPYLTLVHEFLWGGTGDERPVEIDWPATLKRLERECQRARDDAAALVSDAGSLEMMEAWTQDVQINRNALEYFEYGFDDDDDDVLSSAFLIQNPSADSQRAPLHLRSISPVASSQTPAAAAGTAAAAAGKRTLRFYSGPLLAIGVARRLGQHHRFVKEHFIDGRSNGGVHYWHRLLLQHIEVKEHADNADYLDQKEGTTSEGRLPDYNTAQQQQEEHASHQLSSTIVNVSNDKKKKEEAVVRVDNFNERLRHLAQLSNFTAMATDCARFVDTVNFGPYNPRTSLPPDVKLVPDHRVQNIFSRIGGSEAAKPVVKQDIKCWGDAMADAVERGRRHVVQSQNDDAAEALSIWDYADMARSSCARCCDCGGTRVKINAFTVMSFVGASWVSSLLSLIVFIFYPVAYGVSSYSLIQWICSGVCWGCLIVLLLLAPSFWRYCVSSMLFSASLIGGGYTSLRSRDFAQIIDAYFSIGVRIIGRLVPSESIPSDALSLHVLPFLSSKHIEGLYGATAEELQQLKSLLKQSAVLTASDLL